MLTQKNPGSSGAHNGSPATNHSSNQNLSKAPNTFLPGSGLNVVTKSDLNVEVETQVTRKIVQIATWVLTALIFTLFGWFSTTLWGLNSELKELKGKYSSPENLLEHNSARIEKLEKQNQALLDSLHKQRIETLQKEIKQLKEQTNKTPRP